MFPTRLHDPADVDGGKMIQGITYFIPGGGCDYGANPLESIYYILEGEMTLKTEDGETVLHAGDSFHCCGRWPQVRHPTPAPLCARCWVSPAPAPGLTFVKPG